MQEFKIRCSAISQIMTQPRTKAAREAGELSQTAKTYCETWLKEQIYGRSKEISNKYLAKGIELENKAIEFVESYYGYNFLVKNEKRYENEYIIGTPDIVVDVVRDTKCSWDCFTFPLFETEVDPVYRWQMQGYLELTNKETAYVDHVLLNTPEELDSLALPYDEIEDKFRIKSFEVKQDNESYLRVVEQVKRCRKYINQLKRQI